MAPLRLYTRALVESRAYPRPCLQGYERVIRATIALIATSGVRGHGEGRRIVWMHAVLFHQLGLYGVGQLKGFVVVVGV